jgi:hypothetical protein
VIAEAPHVAVFYATLEQLERLQAQPLLVKLGGVYRHSSAAAFIAARMTSTVMGSIMG